jgi:LDH2 family malate/lactate/ureidoglycolate dehydrogenase
LSKGEKQTMTPGEKAFPARAVEEFCVNVLTKAGLSPDCSAIVAESLLCAEMRGIKSHGVLRLESYIQRCEAGVMNIQAPITTEMDNGAVALLNANNTFGSIAGHRAMMLAIDKAKQYGTGVVAVKNSNHFGIAAYYSLMVLKEDMVGCV